MAKKGDPATEIEAARDMAARIAGARLVEYEGEGHLWYDISQEMAEEIRRFISAEPGPTPVRRVLTTILFVDIADSTERASALGDAAWVQVLTQYYAALRRELRMFSGKEVDTAGDGLLATFDGPGRAVRCALAIARAASALGLRTRAGVHTGEVERDGAAIRGVAVHFAARIAACASPGEVYVSSTVVDLVVGSGIDFADRGAHELKGLPQPRHLFAVAPS
jgi:class 3 adenylate cyclase